MQDGERMTPVLNSSFKFLALSTVAQHLRRTLVILYWIEWDYLLMILVNMNIDSVGFLKLGNNLKINRLAYTMDIV